MASGIIYNTYIDYSKYDCLTNGQISLQEFRYAHFNSTGQGGLVQPWQNGAGLNIDWRKTFEIFITAKVIGTHSSARALLGCYNKDTFYKTPSCEIQVNDSKLMFWNGISTNGSSWGNSFSLNTDVGFDQWFIYKLWYDKTKWGSKVICGNQSWEYEKDMSGIPYYNSGNLMVFGNTAQARVAYNTIFDLKNCQITANDNTLFWGGFEKQIISLVEV